jgi:3-methylfumaryl-CoA hydratase
MDLSLDTEYLSQWVGKTEIIHDRIDERQARLLQITLDEEASLRESDELPAFWHYLYFNAEIPASRLNIDGHEKLGRFLPPVALPRRMWAGGNIKIKKPLIIGERATKRSTIQSVQMKQGRSGRLCFVTVDHEYLMGNEICFTERQDIVYREKPEPGAPPVAGKPAPNSSDWEREIRADEVMLFRYSALIFYGHRIHYDIDYTRDEEGYPGLVVHGPLSATLLVGAGVLYNPGYKLKTINIRAQSPLFCGQPFSIHGSLEDGKIKTWARNHDGNLAMSIDLEFDAR